MYADYFGLRTLPFEDRADSRFTFLTPDHEDALTAIEYQLQNGGSLAVVLGEAGIGKTQFIRTFLTRVQKPDQIVVLTITASGQRDLVREVCKGFGVSVASARGGQERRIERLRRHLERTNTLGNRCVLIVDQAENLSGSRLAQIAALADLEHNSRRLLSVLLVGRPQLRINLESPGAFRLKQKLTSEHVLKPFSLEQTSAYIRHRLATAGSHGHRLIDPGAIEWIHGRAEGVPRAIQSLCHEAMTATCDAGETRITRETLARLESLRIDKECSEDLHRIGKRGAVLGAPIISTGPSEPSVRSESSRIHRLEAKDMSATELHNDETGPVQFHGSRTGHLADSMDAVREGKMPVDENDFDPEIGAPAHWCVESQTARTGGYDYSLIDPSFESGDTGQSLSAVQPLFARVERFVRGQHAERIAAVQGDGEARWQALSDSIEPALRLMQSLYEGKASSGETAVGEIETRIENIREQVAQSMAHWEMLEGTCRERMVTVCQAVVEEQRAAFHRAVHEIVEAARQEVKTFCAKASHFVSEAEARMGRMRIEVRESIREWARMKHDRSEQIPLESPETEAPRAGQAVIRPSHESAAIDRDRDQSTPTIQATTDVLRRLDSHHAAASSTLKALASATIEGRQLIEAFQAVDAALRERRKECEQALSATEESVARSRGQASQLQKACAVADKMTTTLIKSTVRASESLTALQQENRTLLMSRSAPTRSTESTRLGQPAQPGDLQRLGRSTNTADFDPLIEPEPPAATTAHPSSPRARG